MKRKIIKQGHNTLTITLPSKWATTNNLNAGDEIELKEEERNLIVTATSGQYKTSKIEIDITGLSTPLLWRYISSAYRDGYDEIHVKWKETYKGYRDLYTAFSYNTLNSLLNQDSFELTQIEAIQALCNRFVGAELIDQKMNSCTIKELVEPSNREFQNSLRRIFLLLLSMSSEIEEAIKSKSIAKERLRGIHMIDTNLDRFEDFCLRVLNKHGYENPGKKSTMHTLIFILELLGDEYKRMSIHLLETDNISDEIKNYVGLINEQMRFFYELFYSFSKEKLIKIYSNDEKLAKIAETFRKDMSHSDAEILHHLKKIGRFIISLIELKIDLVV
jgi:phosphate uptake regulator